MNSKKLEDLPSSMIWFLLQRFALRIAFSACFFLVLVLAGCALRPSKEGFKVVPIRNGGPGERAQKYVAFVPKPNSRPLPVLLFLHGHGEKGSDGLFQISNNFGQSVWRRRNQFPFLSVCPQCPMDDNWESNGPNAKHAIDCLNDAIARFQGDPKRVFIAGISSGAEGAMQIYSSNPNLFAGILLCSSGLDGDMALAPSVNLPIRNLVNKHDQSLLRLNADAANLKWLKAGLSPSVSIVNGSPSLPHNAWDETYESPISLAWLLQSTGSTGDTAPSGFQLLSSQQVLDFWEQSSNNLWKSVETYELLGAPSDDESYLRSPFQDGDAEIHFEVFLEPKTNVQLQVLADKPDAIPKFGSAIDLLLELPDLGTGGVRDDKGTWLAPLDAAAQHALVEGWNEVRIKRRSGTLTIHLGLWPAIELNGIRPDARIRCGIRNGTSGSKVRYIRTARSASDFPTRNELTLDRIRTDVQP